MAKAKPTMDKTWTGHYLNSYNPLVDALREVVRSYDGTGGPKGSAMQAAVEGARRLLQQLGEGK